MQAHARAQTGHVDDAQVAVHQQVGHARSRVDTEGGRLDEANLALLAALEAVLAQMLERLFVLQRQANRRRRAGFEQFLVVVVGVDAVEQDVEVFVPLCFGLVFARLFEGHDVFAGLVAFAVVGDVEVIDLGQLAEAADALGELVAAPVAKDERFGLAFVGLLDVDDGAGDGRDRAGGQQVAAEQRVDERALAHARAAEEDERIGALGQNLLRLIDAELSLGHGADQIVARAVDRPLQLDPLLHLGGADERQRRQRSPQRIGIILTHVYSLPRRDSFIQRPRGRRRVDFT